MRREPRRLIQVGEMAEAVPGAGGTPKPSSHDIHTKGKKLQKFWRRLWLKEFHLSSCLFVFIRVHWWFVFINDQPFFLA